LAESEAFDILYRSSRVRLAVQIAALTGDPTEASDLVQEAFVRAWSHWDRIATYDDPEGWVRRVAYHLAVGRWRRTRKLVLRPDVLRDPTESAGEQLALLVALRSLPLHERRAIVLHYLADLSVEETASELSAPVGTVKSWLSRGRTRLSQELNRDDEVNHDPR
jgi:RNA polymerase sigma-70 factor (ECF subfamily)